jgi:hypothetical protein
MNGKKKTIFFTQMNGTPRGAPLGEPETLDTGDVESIISLNSFRFRLTLKICSQGLLSGGKAHIANHQPQASAQVQEPTQLDMDNGKSTPSAAPTVSPVSPQDHPGGWVAELGLRRRSGRAPSCGVFGHLGRFFMRAPLVPGGGGVLGYGFGGGLWGEMGGGMKGPRSGLIHES